MIVHQLMLDDGETDKLHPVESCFGGLPFAQVAEALRQRQTWSVVTKNSMLVDLYLRKISESQAMVVLWRM